MLLSACRFPGAPSAQTLPPTTSLWTFDETSPAGGIFADSGPADVPMAIVGTWADLSTDSMVQGVGGTSAYTGGSGYATIPADDGDHALSALTVSFYYQPNSAAEKHILLAGSDAASTGIGDFSIEVLTNGRLRGFHVGQDSVLRFFESTNGITGTNLHDGEAHRIDFSLGPAGAKIYLDCAPLTVAFIPLNTNSWNNARVKYLGRWIDGVLSVADGAFDRFRIWGQQLSDVQIASLEPAQTITLPEIEQEELTVPSLAEWLTSDQSDPTVTKYVSNQNRGSGNGLSPANAQEVQSALNSASPGQTFLAVCQTPGTIEFWNYPSGLAFPSGSSGNYVTLQARQGDGVVISAAEDFAGARTPGSGFWTQSGLSGDDISKHIWRSVSTFSGGEQTMMGFWIEFDHPHQLMRAGSMTNLRAAYGIGNSPGNYSGPMVHKDSSGTVWIRMQRPHSGKYSFNNKWSSSFWPGHPEAVSGGQIVYPISQDPNDYVIHLFRVSTVQYGLNNGNSSWVKVGPGINSLGYFTTARGNNMWIDRGTHLAWQSFMASFSFETRTNWFVNRARMSDGSKLHVSRAEWKFGGWLESIRSYAIGMNQAETMSNIYFKDCTIADYHEWFVGDLRANRMRWRNCSFTNIVDDGMQCGYNINRFEVGYCYLRCAYGGLGIAEGGGNDAPVPGEVYWHHNIVDYRQERCPDWRAETPPGYLYLSHSPSGLSPWKVYNNLLIGGPDCEERMWVALMHCPSSTNNTLTGAKNMHEAFNNIVMRVFLEGTKRYDPPSLFQLGPSDFANGGPGAQCIRYSASFSNELMDYNCYWRSPGLSTDGLLFNYRRGTGQAQSNHASVAAWHAHAEFEHSKLSGTFRVAYAPGFDGNSTDSKPTIPAIDNFPANRFKYRPSPTSVVTTAKTGSLSGYDWWTNPVSWGADYFPWNDGEMTLAPSPYKGAFDPNGSTLPVGVQNP